MAKAGSYLITVRPPDGHLLQRDWRFWSDLYVRVV